MPSPRVPRVRSYDMRSDFSRDDRCTPSDFERHESLPEDMRHPILLMLENSYGYRQIPMFLSVFHDFPEFLNLICILFYGYLVAIAATLSTCD